MKVGVKTLDFLGYRRKLSDHTVLSFESISASYRDRRTASRTDGRTDTCTLLCRPLT